MGKFTLVKLKSLRIGSSFTGFSVDDEDAGDLGELSEDDLVLVFDHSHDSVGEQVPVPFIILALMQTCSRER